MSVSRSIALLTQEEFKEATRAAFYIEGEHWFHHIDQKNEFWIGDDNDDVPTNVLREIDSMKVEVDSVWHLLVFLFLQGSESQQLDMFERFLAANLGKGKIVHFWSE
jgi:hypothetical protein